MMTLNKTIALSLSILLVGQNLAFATPPTNNPQTLAQHQQRAKQDVQKAPWIQREGKYILGFGGATAVVLIAQHVKQRRLSLQQHQYWQEVYQRDLAELGELRLANSKLQMQNTGFGWQALEDRWRISDLERQNKRLTAQTDGLSQARQIHRMRIQELERANAALQRQLEANGTFNELFFNISPKAEAEMDKYVPLFDRASTPQMRKDLMRQLRQEPWLKKWPEAQQKEFIATVYKAAEHARMSNNGNTGVALMSMFSKIDTKIPYYQRLLAMSKSLFRSSNLFIVGFAVTLGLLSPNTAKAERTAQRINANFDLFLSATPAQLAELERNKETRGACLAVSEVLHTLSLMTQEEVSPYVLENQRQERVTKMRHTRNRAR